MRFPREHFEKYRKRFMQRINKNGPILIKDIGNCWEWIPKVNKNGYGNFCFHYLGKKLTLSCHRVSFFYLKNEDLLSGNVVNHICDNRKCVNPDHLTQKTHSQNMKDAGLRGNLRLQRLKYCKRGHELKYRLTKNLKFKKNCRICQYAGTSVYKFNKKYDCNATVEDYLGFKKSSNSKRCNFVDFLSFLQKNKTSSV